MIAEQERRLDEFVDRVTEMNRFQEILEKGDKPIMVVWGDGGLGKSSLLARMIHECALRQLRKAEVVWSDTRNHDYLAIMRKIRDDVGLACFSGFTELVNYYTVPEYKLTITVNGSVKVGEGMVLNNSTVENMAGVLIKDSMFVVPRSDMNIPENQRMIGLTDRFLENLVTALSTEIQNPPLVIFFDAIEKMSEKTYKWLWCELLDAVSTRSMENVRFVLCGRKQPQLELDKLDLGLSRLVEEAELKPLEHAHVMEYLGKRGMEQDVRIADLLMLATKGNTREVAVYVDGMVRMRDKRGTEP